MSGYDQQQRGDLSDYERYLQGMDASMQQKVALTAAHLLGEGWLADMGMGSGTGSEALAALYPHMRVTGVDINPDMVSLARDRYQRDNLDFRTGDIAQRCFEPESLDVIFDSSVIHHVTTFNDYDVSKARETIAHQVSQLKNAGNLIIRDFLRPEPGRVWLDLPPSLVPLFQRFAAEFRYLKPPEERGFEVVEMTCPVDRWRRFELEHRHAVEFVLRKDYLADWDTEILEEYTYYTQSEFEQEFRKLGLRILASTPITNPWVVQHRFAGQFRLHDTLGTPLEYPATNYLIVGEKVASGQGVEILAHAPREPLDYLEFTHYQHKHSGSLRDLVRRPNCTLDVVPYFVSDGELYVIARRSYPRPVLSLCKDRLDGAKSPHYVTEPIVVLQQDKPLAQTVEEALHTRTGIQPEQLLTFLTGATTYPSPGGLQEEVKAVFVKTDEVRTSAEKERVRAVSAQQLLRAAQVGGLPDARLELHCFELLRTLRLPIGSWIGESLNLSEHHHPPHGAQRDWPRIESRRAFRRVQEKADFLQLECRTFAEVNASNEVVNRIALEYVQPQTMSLHTISAALLWRTNEDTFLGVTDSDFAAAQCFSGHSNLLVNPAWRLPATVTSLSQAETFLHHHLEKEHGLRVQQTFTLGGPYYPSPGTTPEIVYPVACDIAAIAESSSPLIWLPLSLLLTNFATIKDGHLKVVISRTARALSIKETTL